MSNSLMNSLATYSTVFNYCKRPVVTPTEMEITTAPEDEAVLKIKFCSKNYYVIKKMFYSEAQGSKVPINFSMSCSPVLLNDKS